MLNRRYNIDHKQAVNPKKCTRYITVIVLAIGIISILGIQTQMGMATDCPRRLLYCTESQCNGYLPGYWGCDANATTVSSRYILLPTDDGLNEFRCQTNCKAFWSRTTSSVGGYYIGAALDRQYQTPDYSVAGGSPLGAGLSGKTYMGIPWIPAGHVEQQTPTVQFPRQLTRIAEYS